MRYSYLACFASVVLVLAGTCEESTPAAAADENDVGSFPVCCRSNRGTFPQPQFASALAAQGKKDQPRKLVLIGWPYTNDKYTQSNFIACGSADTEYVWGVILDDNDANFIWAGTTIDSSWRIYFDSVDRPEDMDLRLRVEEVYDGELIGDDTIFQINNTTGKFSEACSYVKRTKDGTRSKAGEKLKIKDVVHQNKKITVKGETDQTSKVYGLLVPAKKKQFKPLVGTMGQGKNWSLEINTAKAPKGDYEVRVRHAKKGQHVYWDRYPITIN